MKSRRSNNDDLLAPAEPHRFWASPHPARRCLAARGLTPKYLLADSRRAHVGVQRCGVASSGVLIRVQTVSHMAHCQVSRHPSGVSGPGSISRRRPWGPSLAARSRCSEQSSHGCMWCWHFPGRDVHRRLGCGIHKRYATNGQLRRSSLAHEWDSRGASPRARGRYSGRSRAICTAL
jgi:hypothetical protein